MMKVSKISKLFMFFFLGALLLNSCSSDDDNFNEDENNDEDIEDKAYADGFFVLNEGQFPNAGTITYVSNDFETVEQEVFQTNNDGEEVGNTPQSMFFDDEQVYVVANASNFVMVADRYTFEKVDTIIGEDGDFSTPRYGVTTNGKAYVTNSGTEHLTVVDTESLEVTGTVELSESSEFIHKGSDGLLYVQEAVFDGGNKVAVVDPATDKVIEEIETEQSLNSIALSENYLYTLTPNKIQKFDLSDDYQEGEAIELSYDDKPANLAYDNDSLYFTSGTKVYAVGEEDTTAPDSAVFEYESDSPFGIFYGFAVHDSKIYAADGGDFASDSFIEIFDLKDDKGGAKINVGVGPNGFYFND